MNLLRMAMVGGAHDSLIGPTHAIASQWSNRANLVAGAFSRNLERSQEAGKAYKVEANRCYASFEELIAKESTATLDFIVIATPNSTHIPYALAAAKKGFHVFCEKPLGTNLNHVQELAEEIENKNLIFSLAHHNTGYAAVRKIKSIVQSEELGTLQVMRSSYIQGWLSAASGKTDTPQAAWRLDPSLSGPSCCLADIGSHALNLMQFVGGRPIANFDATLKSFGNNRQLDDFCHLFLEYEDGVLGIMTSSQISTGYDNDIELHCDCTLGSVSWYRSDPLKIKVRRPYHDVQIIEFEKKTPNDLQAELLKLTSSPYDLENLQAFGNLYDSFFDAIQRKDSNNLVSLEDGAEVLTIISEATKPSL